jgi:hypothetical protein
MPCDIVSLDIQDVMGSHSVNVGGNLYKQRLNHEGKYIAKRELIKGEESDPNEPHIHTHNHGEAEIDSERLI